MNRRSVRIGWTRDREGVYGSAVNCETMEPLGSLSIVFRNNRYEITTYAFEGKMKTHQMNKHQDMPKIKGLARASMLALVGAEI